MKRSVRYAALVALLAGIPVQAMAADAYVTGDVTLRAGPDISYPAVDMIPAGAPIGIEGCTDGWEWCDVVFDDERGWIAGNFIQDEYDSQPVLVPAYGERLGIPIVSFSIVTYWDRYYVSRPFYRERERWYHRPPPHHAPPPPPRRPWAHPQRREDSRGEHDRDDRRIAPAPRGHAEPAPDRAPPYVPAERQRQAAPIPATPPRDTRVPHPSAGHATPTDQRKDAHRGNAHPPSGHDQDGRRTH